MSFLFPIPQTTLGYFVHIAAGIVGSFVVLSVLEHVIHKRMMHTRGMPRFLYKVLPYLNWILEEHAVKHHGKYYKRFDFEPDPEGKEQNLVIGPVESCAMGLALSPLILLVALFVSPIAAGIFCVCGFLHNYTWGKIHRQMHIPEQNSFFRDWALFRLVARHHYMHHEYPMKNFNVVLPFADFLFGAVAKPRLRHVREMLRLGYLKPRSARAKVRVAKLQALAEAERNGAPEPIDGTAAKAA